MKFVVIPFCTNKPRTISAVSFGVLRAGVRFLPVIESFERRLYGETPLKLQSLQEECKLSSLFFQIIFVSLRISFLCHSVVVWDCQFDHDDFIG